MVQQFDCGRQMDYRKKNKGKLFAFLGGGFKHLLFSPLPWEMIQVDDHIFQTGWFNHQLGFN